MHLLLVNLLALYFVGCCLATKVFIGILPAARGVWIIVRWANDERRSWANKIVVNKTLIGVHWTMHLMHPN